MVLMERKNNASGSVPVMPLRRMNMFAEKEKAGNVKGTVLRLGTWFLREKMLLVAIFAVVLLSTIFPKPPGNVALVSMQSASSGAGSHSCA